MLLLSCSSKTDAQQPSRTRAAETEASESRASDAAKLSSSPTTKRDRVREEPTSRGGVSNGSVMFRGGPQRTGQAFVKGPRSANPVWAFRTQGRIYADPVVGADGTLYVASHDGFLYAVSPDGKEKWSFDVRGKIWGTPAIAEDGTVYVGSDADMLFALTPAGELKWTLSTALPPEKKGEKVHASKWDVDTSPVLGKDGTIYFACHYYLFAVRPSGELRWRFQAGIGRVKIFSSPALGEDGVLYFGTQGNRLFAVNASGVAVWSVETGGDNDSTPTTSGDTVYFGSDDNMVRALNTADGAPRWTTDLGAPVRAPLALGRDGTVYVATYGAKPFVAALDGKTGVEQWRFFINDGEGAFYGIQSGVLIDEEGYLYFGGRDRFVYCLTPAGKLKWRYETGDQVDSGPVLGKDGTLYIGSDDRRLRAFR